MARINLRKPKAVALVEWLAVRTGKSTTAIVLVALEAYEVDTVGAELEDVLTNAELDVHARIRPSQLSRQPSRDDLGLELGMPRSPSTSARWCTSPSPSPASRQGGRPARTLATCRWRPSATANRSPICACSGWPDPTGRTPHRRRREVHDATLADLPIDRQRRSRHDFGRLRGLTGPRVPAVHERPLRASCPPTSASTSRVPTTSRSDRNRGARVPQVASATTHPIADRMASASTINSSAVVTIRVPRAARRSARRMTDSGCRQATVVSSTAVAPVASTLNVTASNSRFHSYVETASSRSLDPVPSRVTALPTMTVYGPPASAVAGSPAGGGSPGSYSSGHTSPT